MTLELPIFLPLSAGIIVMFHHTQFILGWDQTQGLVHARQVLYHLSYSPNPQEFYNSPFPSFFLSLFLSFIYLMCPGVLSACMSV